MPAVDNPTVTDVAARLDRSLSRGRTAASQPTINKDAVSANGQLTREKKRNGNQLNPTKSNVATF